MNALAVADSPVLTDESGLVRRFLTWLPRAFPHERADAVNALARAFLHCELRPETRADAEIALTRALDDPEPRVRRALAEAFASAFEAPRHLVLGLAHDVSEVSRAVLALSPLLREADLVDCVGVADAVAQTAIARRGQLAPLVAAALAEVGERAAALALIGNLDAPLRGPVLWRLFDRFENDAEVRARLAERPGLPAALRAAIAAATTADVSDFAAGAWLDPRRVERIARDGREQAFVAIAADCAEDELAELVAWLRANAHLTVALLVRALAGGDVKLFAQSLADMSGAPSRKVAGLLRDPRGHGFAALYRRAGLPAPFLPAFRIAAELAVGSAGAGIGLNYPLTQRMLREIEAREDSALTPIVAMLWRLASEGAREDAREFTAIEPAATVETAEVATGEAPLLVLDIEPSNENFAPPVTLDLAPEPIEVAA